MLRSTRPGALIALSAMFIAGCGGGGGTSSDAGAPAEPEGRAESSDMGGSSIQPSPPADAGEIAPPDAPADGGAIDWATVDLASVDWATIDLTTVDWTIIEGRSDRSEVDFAAMSQNPTIGAVGEGGGGGGHATFSIGDEVWEFDRFVCAIGIDATQSEIWPFSTSGIITLPDGVRVQLMAEIYDDLEEGRLSGDGTVRSVSVEDISNFDDPQVGWYADDDPGSGFGQPGDLAWQFDGNNLVAEGTFRSTVEFDGEPVHGRLVAECGR